MKHLFVLFLTTLICLCNSEVLQDDDEVRPNTPARLLVEKRVLNTYLVENQDINIRYSIYNVGGNVATNVQLNDNNLPPLYFEKLNSTDSIKVNSIPPNGKVVDTLVFKPKIGTHGRVNFTSAEVVYQSKDSSSVLRTQSSEPGYAYILSNEDYEKRFSLHLFEWIVFSALSLVSLAIPFSLYNKSKSKYESIKNKSK